MTVDRHTKKEVADAIDYAMSRGWRCERGSGHVWAILKCPRTQRDGCKLTVFSTPENSGNHANRLKRAVDKCPHVNA